MPDNEAALTFEPHRRHLTGLAYRMLGSLADAEDIVQDAYLRWCGVARDKLADPRAYLASTVARLCLDHFKSARVRREHYVGLWLPEPIVDTSIVAPDISSELADDVSVALMMTLERLSPLERAAFILHDVFNMDFEAIAGVLDRNVAACRQLAARARVHVHDSRPRFKASAEQASKLSRAFYQAVMSGDIAALGRTLAKDAVLYADGGGKRATALSPIRGRDNIIRFFEDIAHDPDRIPIGSMRPILLNGLPGFVIVDGDGAVETIALEIDHDGIAAMYAVRNPEKLTHLVQSIP